MENLNARIRSYHDCDTGISKIILLYRTLVEARNNMDIKVQ